MRWIRVASRVSKDAKVRELARRAGCGDPHKIVGHLVSLWGEMSEQAQDGNLSTFTDDDIETWAEWSGRRCKAGAFAPALRALLCDEHGVMTAWDEYNGAAIREMEADRKRKSGKHSPGVPPEFRGNSGGIPLPPNTTLPNRTEGSVVGGGDAREPKVPTSAVRPPGPVAGHIAPSPDETPGAGELAVTLARAANQAVAEVWGESTTPYVASAGAAHDCARAVLADAVPADFAERAVFTLCRTYCQRAKDRHAPDDDQRPGSMLYFPKGVRRLWAREQAAIAAATAPAPDAIDAPDVAGFSRPGTLVDDLLRIAKG